MTTGEHTMPLPAAPRRTLLLAAAALAAPRVARAQALERIRFVLNFAYDGSTAPFIYAESRGYFREAGIEAQIDQDDGPGGVEFSKKAGLRLFTLWRHAQLTGDRIGQIAAVRVLRAGAFADLSLTVGERPARAGRR
jgi:hypothetical protein